MGAGDAWPALPMGFEKFHRGRWVNYQLNRAHALGLVPAEDLRRAASEVRRAADCPLAFDASSRAAERDGRRVTAFGTARIAEFFTQPSDPLKLTRYQRCRSLFDRAFESTGVVRVEVPYGEASLPAYRCASRDGGRGTVLVHGGFDSLIEEFVVIWLRLAEAGFDVIAFDGPGQGGARALGGLTFDHDWERPVGAVLDHFDVQAAGLVGISMGGYWALRAAGLEARIDRVVSWPPVYDWLLRVPAPLRPATRAMLRQRGFMRWSVRVRARLVPTLRQVVDQVLYLVDSDDEVDVVDWFLGMNPTHLGSARVIQPVLLMSGEHDRFQPPKLTDAQAAALTGARSVRVRTFTSAERADQHCQLGNVDLACRVLTEWLADPASNLEEA